jgi:hypothetical protein
MLGPSDATDAAGGGPAFAGTSFTSSVFWSGIHRSELPSMGFRRALPRRRIAPVAASQIHGSTASFEVFRNANRRPSAAHATPSTQPSGGSVTGVSRLVAMSTSVSVCAQGAIP